MAQKPWIVPVPGTTLFHHLDENLASIGVTFTANELQQFRTEIEKVKLIGNFLL